MRTEPLTVLCERECILLAEQRDRIARDLHDHTIGRLFGVGLMLETVVAAPHGERAALRIQQAVDEIRTAIAELRAATWGETWGEPTPTAPTSTESLRTEVHRMISEKTRFTSVCPSIRVDGPDALVDADVRAGMMAALSESVVNVVKHAHATAIAVLVVNTRRVVSFIVADDGCGIDFAHPFGDGLRNIRYRASEFGGSSSIGPRSDGGTIVCWEVPLRRGSLRA